MYSLYHSLLAQHAKQLNPVPCAHSTITQLHRFFEDVVLENNLAALVIESLPSLAERSTREVNRIRELSQVARSLFLSLSPDDNLSRLLLKDVDSKAIILDRSAQDNACERFVVIADARFSALLASIHGEAEQTKQYEDLVIWTFEPDIVYSALEYLMARITAEQPFRSSAFAKTVSLSMPQASSLQLTLAVTTKLARLLQEQAQRELAVNRIATAIRNSLELNSVLLTAASEVGRALNVDCCAVRVAGNLVGRGMTSSYFPTDETSETANQEMILSQLEALSTRLQDFPRPYVCESDDAAHHILRAHAVVPLIFDNAFAGLLLVHAEDASRVWADNELLLLHTVADQLAVAVNQAHLFAQMQEQALTDALTGCHNRRSFEMQLKRDLHLAVRMRQPLSLVMLDIDNFKSINDGAGHETGDRALRELAETLRAELRAVDTAVRFGGDEFAVILPQASTAGAVVVAERLRCRIEQLEISGFGNMTASFGVATFPTHASSCEDLNMMADKALYISKHSGCNRVSTPPDKTVASE